MPSRRESMWVLFLALIIALCIGWCFLRRSNLAFANLVVILSYGVLVSWWILYYTDWFVVVGGLLALGGAFSWLALVSRALSKERTEAIQEWIDREVLNRHRTGVAFLALLLLGFTLGNFVGAVEV